MLALNRQHITAQLFFRVWPFQRGVGRLINTLFPNTTFDEDIVLVPTTDAVSLTIFPNDHIGRHIYLTGEYEHSTIEVICNFAEGGETLLDIGANIGYISACFLKNVVGSKVIAVDPQPGVLDLLKSNLSQFSPDRYEIMPVAISDRDGTALFAIDAENRGGSGIVDAGASDGTITVRTRSADALFQAGHFTDVKLVKIDVEGHEEQILQSCKKALQRLQPRAILFEEQGTKSAPDEPIGQLFDDIGYRVFGLKKRLFRTELVPIRSPADCNCNDYLAVSKSQAIPQKAKSAYPNLR